MSMRGLRFFETERSRVLRRASSSAEDRLWAKLRARRLAGFKFIRQDNIGPYFVDFVCRDKRLVVEVDGATHSAVEEVRRDARRESFLRERGFRMVRVTNDEVFHNLDGVCETILAALAEE
jgi:very-short-patch-repair endonuclease